MRFRENHSLKPKFIRQTGEVVFEDKEGLEHQADLFHCLSYGYIYEKSCSICRVQRKMSRQKVAKIKKRQRKVQDFGSNNKLADDVLGVLVNGSKNEVLSGIKNAAVLGGSHAKLMRQGEVMQGGGIRLGGYIKSSMIGNVITTDAVEKYAYLLGSVADENIANHYSRNVISLDNNTISIIECDVIAVVIALNEGVECDGVAVGDYSIFRNSSNMAKNPLIVKKDNAGTITKEDNTFIRVNGTNEGLSCTMRDLGDGIILGCTGIACAQVDWYVSYDINTITTTQDI